MAEFGDYREKLILRIEVLFQQIFSDIELGVPSELIFVRKRTWDVVDSDSERAPHRTTSIKLGSRNSLRKFGMVMKVLSAVHLLLLKNNFCTKRDLYYQDPAIYGNQAYLDEIISCITSMLQVPRWHLHVLATSKGLIAGDLTFKDPDGTVIHCNETTSGILLPSLMHRVKLISSQAQYVLVVEKDATFQHLVQHKNTLKSSIIITAKGYPDLVTRMMLRLISDCFSHIPIYALVDSDPHGVEIYLVYKFGSLSQSHDVENLAVPKIEWLGVKPSDLLQLILPKQVFLPMSTRDRAKVQDMSQRKYMATQHQNLQELSLMLEKGKKVEIQSLDSISRNFLTEVYLPEKLKRLQIQTG